MDEREWLTSRYPGPTLEKRRGWYRSHRKLRLLAAAACRRVWPALSQVCQAAVEFVERRADGKATRAERKAACPRTGKAFWSRLG